MADPYLVDIAHVRDFQASPSGDLGLISGISNLRNALYHRLVTVPGALVHRPDFGCGVLQFQGRLNRLSAQRDLALVIQEQFELDPRVQAVLGVLVEADDDDPSIITITVRVQAVGRDETTMTFIPFSEA